MSASPSHVLVLVTPPDSRALSASLIDTVSAALAATGATPGEAQWLAPDVAVDLPFAPGPSRPALESLSAHWAGQPIDAGIVALKDRRKRLLIADMDSTMIEVECIDEIADALGLKDRVAAITEQAMTGEIPFEGALKDRVALLKGLDQARLEDIYRSRIRFTPGGRALVQSMAAHGAVTALVSGGFTFFTDRVGEALGFQHTRANVLDIGPDGTLTGEVIEPIQGREAKREALEAFARDAGLALNETLAVGDGANDLAMISVAGLGVAFHAKPAVAAAADIAIQHTDLTTLLYLQGYRADEILG